MKHGLRLPPVLATAGLMHMLVISLLMTPHYPPPKVRPRSRAPGTCAVMMMFQDAASFAAPRLRASIGEHCRVTLPSAPGTTVALGQGAPHNPTMAPDEPCPSVLLVQGARNAAALLGTAQPSTSPLLR